MKYVNEIIAPNTVNTVPPAALTAFRDHGTAALTIEYKLDEAEAELKKLPELGIDIKAVCAKLLEDGLKAFNASFESLMSAIDKKKGA